MAKKIKAELELDVQKAKQKAAEVAQTGGSSVTGGALSPKSRAEEEAARSIGKLSKAAEEGQSRLGQMAKMMGGMAVQMATSYAASHMQPGAMRDGVSFLGNVAGGAIAGSAAGPWGALAGGAMGAAKAGLEISASHEEAAQKQADTMRDFERGESNYANGRGFQKFLKNLTEVEGKDSLNASIETLAKKIKEYNAVIEEQVGLVKKNIKEEDYEKATFNQGQLGINRSRVEAMEAASDALKKEIERLDEKEKDKKGSDFRVSEQGLDALSRIGANFGGGDGAREALTVAKDQLTVLKDIERKTGGYTWQ